MITTNLKCLIHPKYDGNGYVVQGCYNCVNIFMQVLRAKRDLAIETKRSQHEVHVGMQGMQAGSGSGQNDG